MKYLKRFNEEIEEKSIKEWCVYLDLSSYSINDTDGTVDVRWSVNISSLSLETIPITFNNVKNSFICSDNKLISLKGSPNRIGGHFNCDRNKLTTLIGGTKILKTPTRFTTRSVYSCDKNKLTSLEGGPNEFPDDFDFYCMDNPINTIYKLFPDYKSCIESINDYNFLRDDMTVIKGRLTRALKDFNSIPPENIEPYKYI
jgi:hypothetical protein